MEQNDGKWIIVFLCVALSIMIGGCFSGYFIVYVWVNTVRLTSAAYANDAYVAMTLCAYFVMCAFTGAAVGLMLNGLIDRVKNASVFAGRIPRRRKSDA